MKTALFSTLTAIALSLGLANGPVNGGQTPPTVPATQNQAAPAGQKLTDESLMTMLQNMGYTPRLEMVGSSKLYWLTLRQDGLDYSVSIQISPNKEKIWLIVPLADLPKNGTIAAENLLRLLDLNDQIGPSYFRFNQPQGRLYMSRAFDNRATTPALLRDNLDRMTSNLSSTRNAWNHDNWANPVTAKAK